MIMLWIIFTERNISNYMPQIINGLFTLLGIVFGWLLNFLTCNSGKVRIYVSDFKDQKRIKDEYGCIIKLFINNTSHKQQCIHNARLSFTKFGKGNLFETELNVGECNFASIKSQTNKKMISINSCSQGEYTLSAVINGEKYAKLSEARTIFLVYRDRKNHIKKEKIKSGFVLNSVESNEKYNF